MSGHNNQFEGIGGGIRSLLMRLGLRLAPDGRGEDLLDLPGHSEIEFASLSPTEEIRDSIATFSELSASWVRKHTEDFAFQLALQLAGNGHVQFQTGRPDFLCGEVTDARATYTVTMAIGGVGLATNCSCLLTKTSSSGYTVPCEHAAALLLDVIAEKRIPMAAAVEITPVCPITRQQLSGMRVVYRCSRCGLNISPDGWEFLRTMDRGKCCSCGARGTIAPRPVSPE